MNNSAALDWRRLQMLTEIGVETNTTTLVMILSYFINLAKELADSIEDNNNNQKHKE